MDERKKSWPRQQGSGILYCSFCGKPQYEVRKILAGANASICDECIDLSNEIIAEEAFHTAEKRGTLETFILYEQMRASKIQENIARASRALGASFTLGGDTLH
jgi:hypothetical protein